jgi:hypothetical protein
VRGRCEEKFCMYGEEGQPLFKYSRGRIDGLGGKS